MIALALGAGLAPDAHAADKAERHALRMVDVQRAPTTFLEDEARHTLLESIARLQGIVADGGFTGDRRAEVLLRLADLYYQEGHDTHADEMARYLAALDACADTKGCDPATIRLADYTEASRAWTAKSIALYQQILASYPTYARADEASYYLALALIDTGKPDDANATLTGLVKQWPASAFAPDAYVLVGEYWFDGGNAAKALAAYQRAATFSGSDKQAFARYKSAWCLYNLGDLDGAVSAMTEVAERPPVAGAPIVLQDEALKDLVHFLADKGDVDAAYALLQRLGKIELLPGMLEQLAQTSATQGKLDDAIVTWRRLITLAPDAPDAARYEDAIVDAIAAKGRKDDALAELDTFQRTYGKQGAWARANATHPEAVTAAATALEEDLRTAALAWHNEARKLRTGPDAAHTYALAGAAYDRYLEAFPSGPHEAEMRYGDAELLYTTRKFDAAYDQYMRVVALDPSGPRAHFCAQSAIFAAEELAKQDPPSGPAADKVMAIPLSPSEQKEIAALDQYARLYTDDKTRSVIYKSAWIYYGKNHFQAASERFNTVIALDPGSKEAEQAANLILDSFALAGDWEALAKNAKFYHDQLNLGSDSFRKEVYGIYENASLKRVEAGFERDGDKARAAAGYLAFYHAFPTSPNADLALHDAAVYLHDVGQIPASLQARQALVTHFPTSRYFADDVAGLGFDYESLARFDDAATWYEKLANVAPTHPSAPDALYSAALFRASLGQWEQAERDDQRYVATWPDRPGASRAALDGARLYEEHQHATEASAAYARFFTTPPAGATVDERMYARLHYGVLLAPLGQGARAARHWQDSLAWFATVDGPPSDAATACAAEMMFRAAEPQYDAYVAMKIDGPGSRALPPAQVDALLHAQVLAKVRAMARLEATYGAVIRTGAGEWGLAALARIGTAYENLHDTLEASYVPPSLTADQREIYTDAIHDTAFTQDEKAAAAYAAVRKMSFELSLYNDTAARATRRLAALHPDEAQALAEILPAARFATPAGFTGGFEREE